MSSLRQSKERAWNPKFKTRTRRDIPNQWTDERKPPQVHVIHKRGTRGKPLRSFTRYSMWIGPFVVPLGRPLVWMCDKGYVSYNTTAVPHRTGVDTVLINTKPVQIVTTSTVDTYQVEPCFVYCTHDKYMDYHGVKGTNTLDIRWTKTFDIWIYQSLRHGILHC